MVQSLSKPTKTILELEPTVNVWVNVTWDEFVSFSERSEFVKSKAFYFNGQMRIETMGVGADHARDNSILALVVSLFCITMGISIDSFTNVSYRKPGFQEIQPDLSYYVGDGQVPTGSSIVDLTDYPVPDLAIEIADSSLSEDLGKKRLALEPHQSPNILQFLMPHTKVVSFPNLPTMMNTLILLITLGNVEEHC